MWCRIRAIKRAWCQRVECCAIMFLALYISTARAELLLRYTFDEAFEGIDPVLDMGAAPAANGVFVGSATRTNNTPADLTCAALNVAFDGNHYLNAGDVPKLNALSGLTITLWINLREDATAGDRLVSKGSAFDVNIPNGGTVATELKLGFMINNSYINNPVAFDALEKWVFVAVTWDGATRRFYTGGEDRAGVVTQLGGTFAYSAATTPSNTSDFRVGATALASPRTPPAWIDDVRVYDIALTLEELDVVRKEGIIPQGSIISSW